MGFDTQARGEARRRWIGLLLALAFIGAAPAGAGERKTWTLRDQKELAKGEPKGIRLGALGGFSLGPTVRDLARVEEGFLWCLLADGEGRLVLGTGGEGKVYRIAPDGAVALLADLEGDHVFALAPGPKGGVFAATSPEGRIYSIDESGRAEVYYDPDAPYIWSLAFDPASGRLYAGTGTEGKVYVVKAGGEGEVLFETGEVHVTALALDGAGGVLAGTVEHGYVFRIDLATRAGRLVYDSPFQEVRALRVSEAGLVRAVVDDGPSFAVTKKEEPQEQPKEGKPKATADVFFSEGTPPKGELATLRPDGTSERMLAVDNDMIMGVADGPGGSLYAVTMGSLLEVSDRERADQLFHLEGGLITSLVRVSPGRYAFCTSTEGAVYLVDSDRAAEGRYVSPVTEAATVAAWGALAWSGSAPSGSEVRFFGRSGNTGTPDAFWSDWTGPITSRPGEALGVPPGRYFQWKAELKAGGTAGLPAVERVEVSYREQNRPPVLKDLTVHPPSVTFAAAEGKDTSSFEEADEDTMFVGPDGSSASDTRDFGKKKRKRAARTVTWDGSDPDGDTLVYSVALRPADGEARLPVRKEQTEEILSFDSTLVPDGEYRVRVEASDRRGNPEGTALTDAVESERFVVDNTPPEILALQAAPSTGGFEVRFQAADGQSALVRADYAADGGRWAQLRPADGIADQRRESFAFSPQGLTSGTHLLAVRVVDGAGNPATRFLEVRVP